MNAAGLAEFTQNVLAGHESLRRLWSNVHKTFGLADRRTVEVIFVNDGYEATRGGRPMICIATPGTGPTAFSQQIESASSERPLLRHLMSDCDLNSMIVRRSGVKL